MALLFMESFVGATTDLGQKWNVGSTANTIASATPHASGGWYALMYSTTAKKTVTASSKLIVGTACYFGNTTPEIGFWGDSGATQHIAITRNASGFIEIRRGIYNGTILATGTTAIPQSVWTYIEISVTVSDTVGEVHIRLNGSNTDEVSYTGDTKNGGTSTNLDAFHIWAGGSGNTNYTDIYCCNDTGSANNAFLGEVVVRALSPNNNGNSSQLVGSDGNSTDNYLLVDERPFSSSDYVGSPTTGQKDTYTLGDLPAGATTVYGVQINTSMHKSDVSAAQSRSVIRTGSTDYGGTTRLLSVTPVTYIDLFEQNPNTSVAWTAANVNGLEAGMEVM